MIGPINKLNALTICFHYSDYLSEVLSNQSHFDSWTVLTLEDDIDTKRLCHTAGIKVIESKSAGPEGASFDSAYFKAPIINEGLNQLSSDGWCLIIDADILLPRNFRARLNNYHLYRRALYGLYGRRECETWQEYEWRKTLEPWSQDLGHHPNILGYFQLFRLDQEINRYPVNKLHPEMHDDIAFQYLFKPQLRRFLPLTALHVGPPQKNWQGRKTPNFRANSGTMRRPIQSVGQLQALANLEKFRHLLVIGLDPSTPIQEYLDRAEYVTIVDWHGIFAEPVSSLHAQDAYVQKRVLHQLLLEFPSANIYLDASIEGLRSLIESKKFDAILFDIELRLDVLCWWCELFEKVLRDRCVIIGKFYGLPKWNDIVIGINLLLGTPQENFDDGSWRLEIFNYRLADCPLAKFVAPARRTETRHLAVFRVADNRDVEKFLTLLCGPLRDWAGMLGLVDACDHPAIEILRTAIGVQLFPAVRGQRKGTREDGRVYELEAIYYSDYDFCLFTDLAVADIDDWTRLRNSVSESETCCKAIVVRNPSVRSFMELGVGNVQSLLILLGVKLSPDMHLNGSAFAVSAIGWHANSLLIQAWINYGRIFTQSRINFAWDWAGAAAMLSRPHTWRLAQDASSNRSALDTEVIAPSSFLRSVAWTTHCHDTCVCTIVPEKMEEVFLQCLVTWHFTGAVRVYVFASNRSVGILRERVQQSSLNIRIIGIDKDVAVRIDANTDHSYRACERQLLPYIGKYMKKSQWVVILPSMTFPIPGASLGPVAKFSGASLTCEMLLAGPRKANNGKSVRVATRICYASPLIADANLLASWINSRRCVFPKSWREHLLRFAVANDFDVAGMHVGALGWLSRLS